jgi:hypothetical protein
MSDEKPRWAKVPGEFVERGGGLSFRAWRMYVALALFANRSGQAWPSHSTLRRLLGRNEWSRWQVRDAIRELKEAGWLEAEGSRRESDGGKGSNTYLLQPQPWPRGTPASGSSATPMADAPHDRRQQGTDHVEPTTRTTCQEQRSLGLGLFEARVRVGREAAMMEEHLTEAIDRAA